jgi:bacillithiol biosynthesis cysteine-adding enzyme BshC
MQIENIPLISTGQLHPLAKDYLENPSQLSEFLSFAPSLEGIREAKNKRKNFNVNRILLCDSLEGHYKRLDAEFFNRDENKAVKANIELLRQENTFTITTGHQLNIFTGPLYFIYKIISAISYADLLKEEFPDCHFVPVYWMASEDHDFEEINHIHLFGKSLKWEAEVGGPVGRMSPGGIRTLLDQLSELINRQAEGQKLMGIFTKAYTEYPTLSLATTYIVNALFKSDGLVIIDADDAKLKREFIPVFKADILTNKFFAVINETKGKLSKYSLPVNPREINVFYFAPGARMRIVKDGETYKADGHKSWSETELMQELDEHPENFSPNVVLRPMYQETILPNLAYIGGNNEIAYWLELKSAFDLQGTFFPQLLIRDSALWIGKRFAKDMESFGIAAVELFLPLRELKQVFYKKNELHHPAEEVLTSLAEQYELLKEKIKGSPSDLAALVVKQANEHQKELKRLSKEIQRKKEEGNEKSLGKLDKLYASVFPENSLQERHDNFIPYYLQYGDGFFKVLKDNFNPLEGMMRVMMDK